MQTSIHFFNTNQTSPENLVNEITRALSLQDRVYSFFKLNVNKGFIWSDVVSSMGLRIEQHGSVKRCLTNLMTDGKLYKSTNTKLSVFGKKAHYYFYNSQ